MEIGLSALYGFSVRPWFQYYAAVARFGLYMFGNFWLWNVVRHSIWYWNVSPLTSLSVRVVSHAIERFKISEYALYRSIERCCQFLQATFCNLNLGIHPKQVQVSTSSIWWIIYITPEHLINWMCWKYCLHKISQLSYFFDTGCLGPHHADRHCHVRWHCS